MADLPNILVVEDDLMVQALVEDTLQEGGFQTAALRTGEEGVTLIKGAQVAYRAVVTDIDLLGRIDGWAVARAAREIDPTIAVVYMTGHAAEQWPAQGVPNSVLLQKPFAPAQLLTAVSQLLNASSPSPPPT